MYKLNLMYNIFIDETDIPIQFYIKDWKWKIYVTYGPRTLLGGFFSQQKKCLRSLTPQI